MNLVRYLPAPIRTRIVERDVDRRIVRIDERNAQPTAKPQSSQTPPPPMPGGQFPPRRDGGMGIGG
jgi:hypothetical protein